MYAHNVVIRIPKTKTEHITITILSGVMIASSSGSYFTARYAESVRIAPAAAAETTPIQKFLIINGLLINPQLAPTSFMV